MEDDPSPLRDEVTDSIAHTPTQDGGLQALSAESLSHPVFLNRRVTTQDAERFAAKPAEPLYSICAG